MRSILEFGEQREGYGVRVLNERAVRASAGILFLFAIVAFMNAWLSGNFQPARVFVVAFLIDFAIRIFVNPRFAPSLIVGQWIVHRQQPEWVGAPQKRFAWAIGFVLALTMLYLVVLNNLVGPVNLVVCATCLALLFFEASFGICLGCKVYNLFHGNRAELCPGGVCEVEPAPRRRIGAAQVAVVALFALAVGAAGARITHSAAPGTGGVPAVAAASAAPADAGEAERCKVPDFAKALGHEEKWKLHNNCK
jgi:hypothetical protein